MTDGKKNDGSDEAEQAVVVAAPETAEASATTPETAEASAAASEAKPPESANSEAADADVAQSSAAPANAPEYPAWSAPIAALDAFWTRVDSKLLFAVLLAEIGSLVFWTTLNGFTIVPQPGDSRGIVLRAAFFAALFGALAFRATRSMDTPAEANAARVSQKRQMVTTVAILVGILLGVATKSVGLAYTRNVLNWLQNASVLLLVGGVRGLVTRLTLWLALLGASLATAKGKHIHVDLALRHVPDRARVPVAVFGWIVAAAMCLTGAWGFLDQLIIGEYRVERLVQCGGVGCPEKTPSMKLGEFGQSVRRDAFLLGRQASLDFQTIPHVIRGESYAEYMTPAAWNTWFDAGSWDRFYPKEALEGQRVPADRTDPKIPAVNVPGGDEDARGILVRDMNLVIPFGLFVLAIRFVLRALLAVAGRVRVDPDAAHADDDDEPKSPTLSDAEVAS